jgi:lauroyl/myristoyl acyltransferase
MNVQQFATSSFGTNLWMSLGHLPKSTGHRVARMVAGILHRRKRAFAYQTIYANQAGVFGAGAAPEEIDAAVRRVLVHGGMCSFDLAHAIAHGEDAIVAGIELGDEFWPNVEAARATGQGMLVCGIHLSNFNLGFLAFALQGNIQAQVLSTANTGGGFRYMSELRNRGVFDETPIDGPALRKAIRRLREGGTAVIGVDWPVDVQPEDRLPFFGRPARLSTGYIRLALSANALLLPLRCCWEPTRGYYLVTTPPLELERTGNHENDVLRNACRMLAVAEQWVRATPDQWLMYHRVWADGEGG